MELKINNIESLLAKKVPNHGKISGVKNKCGVVRVIVPNEDTQLSLMVTEPSEVLSRNVTPDGKVLGLTNYIGKTIYIIDQKIEDFRKDTGYSPLFGDEDEISDETLKYIFDLCDETNLDIVDLLKKGLDRYESEINSKKEELNE